MQTLGNTISEEVKQAERRVLPVLAKYFWLFYTATIIVATLVCYHKIFSVLPHPVITTGVTGAVHKTYQMRGYSRYTGSFTIESFARNIWFNWQDKSYKATGGWDEPTGEGAHVNVIFNESHPEEAYELSTAGLIDFALFRRVVPIWILLSGLLFAFASSDAHFTAFNFNIPNLTTRPFICLLVIVLFIPLGSSVDLLIFGKKTTGVMTGDFDCSTPSGKCLNAIVFNVSGKQYSIYSEYANEYGKDLGPLFPLLYRPDNPGRCCIYDLEALYSNYLVALMIFSLLVIVSWFIASKT